MFSSKGRNFFSKGANISYDSCNVFMILPTIHLTVLTAEGSKVIQLGRNPRHGASMHAVRPKK